MRNLIGRKPDFKMAVVAVICFYFVPTWVAMSRKHKNIGAIFTLNLLLGLTFIGWVVALIWALKND